MAETLTDFWCTVEAADQVGRNLVVPIEHGGPEVTKLQHVLLLIDLQNKHNSRYERDGRSALSPHTLRSWSRILDEVKLQRSASKTRTSCIYCGNIVLLTLKVHLNAGIYLGLIDLGSILNSSLGMSKLSASMVTKS